MIMISIKKFIWKRKKCKKCGTKIKNWKSSGYIGFDTIVCGTCFNKDLQNKRI